MAILFGQYLAICTEENLSYGIKILPTYFLKLLSMLKILTKLPKT